MYCLTAFLDAYNCNLHKNIKVLKNVNADCLQIVFMMTALVSLYKKGKSSFTCLCLVVDYRRCPVISDNIVKNKILCTSDKK